MVYKAISGTEALKKKKENMPMGLIGKKKSLKLI